MSDTNKRNWIPGGPPQRANPWLRLLMVGLMLIGIAEAGSGQGQKVSAGVDKKSRQTAGLLPSIFQDELVGVIVQFKYTPTMGHFRKVEWLGGFLFCPVMVG